MIQATPVYTLYDTLTVLHNDVVKAFKSSDRKVTRERLHNAIVLYLAQPKSYPELRVNFLYFAPGDQRQIISEWFASFVRLAKLVPWDSYDQGANAKISEIENLISLL